MAVDDQDLDQDGGDPSELVKKLRAELKDRNAKLADAEGAKRELAFVKAGIDTSTKLGQLFAKSFDGDVADIEAIKGEAKELGLIGSTEPSGTDTTAKPEVQDPNTPPDTSASERSNLANGGTADDGSGVDPRQTALGRAEQALKDGAPFDRAAGGLVAELAKAAMAGDQRVVVRGNFY